MVSAAMVPPDFIIEIVSPGNPSDDYIRKLYYYKNAGVREYWIVDPRRKTVTVNYFEGNMLNVQYSFDSTIKVNIYDDLYINFSDIAGLLNISVRTVETQLYRAMRTLRAKLEHLRRTDVFLFCGGGNRGERG